MRKPRLLVVSFAASLALVTMFLVLLLRPSGNSETAQLHGRRLMLVPVSRRRTLPDLAAAALSPPPAVLRLSSLRGRPAFIDVWASWCVPCREEAPGLARLWRRYRSRVQFLGIDVEDSRGDARAFLHRYGLGYPSIFDRQASLAGRLGFFGLPTAYLVDERGRIAARLIGKQRLTTLASGLAAVAGEAKSGR